MIPIKDRNPTMRKPVVTVVLILVNVGVFILIQRPSADTPDGDLRFSYDYAAIPCEVVTGEPLDVGEIEDTLQGDHSACDEDRRPAERRRSQEVFPEKRVWLAVVASMFLHGGWLHLGGNMLFLWVFGNNIEDHLGPVRYIAFYLLGGLVAAFAHFAVDPGSTIPVVGASGAVAGVMGAYLVWFPRAPVLTAFLFILIFVREIEAKWLLIFWFILQFFTGPDSGVAWAAHVGGFVFGAVVALFVRQNRNARKVAWRPEYAGAGWDPYGGLPPPPPNPDDSRFGRR
ncbi:rhomboid family intramembrane serine protease [soil metagenome]